MELKLFHVAVLLLQPVAYLQQSAVHGRIIQGGTDLQRLLDVVLQPLPDLVGDFLIGIHEPGHFLNSRLGQVHQALHLLFGIVLELQAEVFTPQLQSVERFIR
jgi:hypothetical protein